MTYEPGFRPLTAQQALQHAAYFTRYALDRIGTDGRLYHPGVRSHATSAEVQLRASAEMATPTHDQVLAEPKVG